MKRILDVEHKLLEEIFPRHVLQVRYSCGTGRSHMLQGMAASANAAGAGLQLVLAYRAGLCLCGLSCVLHCLTASLLPVLLTECLPVPLRARTCRRWPRHTSLLSSSSSRQQQPRLYHRRPPSGPHPQGRGNSSQALPLAQRGVARAWPATSSPLFLTRL